MPVAPATDQRSPETVAHLVALLRDFDAATLVTRSRGGSLHGRPMSVARVDDDATLWFITSAASAKSHELADDARAMVTFQSGERFACLNGNAELVFDPLRIKQLWQEKFRVWFSSPHDSDIVLVRFNGFDAEYWDNSGLNGIKHAFQAARAYAAGRSLDPAAEANDTQSHARIKLWDPGEASSSTSDDGE
jgi:general stress protein 26